VFQPERSLIANRTIPAARLLTPHLSAGRVVPLFLRMHLLSRLWSVNAGDDATYESHRMQLKKLLEKRDLTSLKISTPFTEMSWEPRDEDKTAAWELYVELITRVATQHLEPVEGDEAAAVKSIAELFCLTRETIKRDGRYCINFTRIAVVVLNQKVRPFTVKWHRRMLGGALTDADGPILRAELRALQTDLRNYTRLLADLAGVEDLTDLERLSAARLASSNPMQRRANTHLSIPCRHRPGKSPARLSPKGDPDSGSADIRCGWPS